jgi:NADH:ubiquinone oxidoreductase subunit 5 (subunit L)/multisubunit Na+/H+ antiporter MnhA subunit
MNWFFARLPVTLDYQSDIYIRRITFIQNFLISRGYTRKFLLVYNTADAMFTILLVLYTLVFFNIYLNYNYFSIFELAPNFFLGHNLIFFPWISFHYDFINFGFTFDHLSLLMLVVVLTISTLVHYYSLDYMSKDP